MKSIKLIISNKSYDIRIDEESFPEIEEELQRSFELSRSNDIKVLLEAYIKKSYEYINLKEEFKEYKKRKGKK